MGMVGQISSKPKQESISSHLLKFTTRSFQGGLASIPDVALFQRMAGCTIYLQAAILYDNKRGCAVGVNNIGPADCVMAIRALCARVIFWTVVFVAGDAVGQTGVVNIYIFPCGCIVALRTL
jgi:hypothetical protein